MNKKALQTDIVLENERVLLLPFENERHIELKNIIFDPDIWEFMGMRMDDEENLQQYIAHTLQSKKESLCYPFLIIDKKTDEVAGCTRYGNINLASEKCEIGWTWYGKKFWGTGLNKACKFELLEYGFNQIGFRRIQFSTDSNNIGSQKAIKKLGATQEGLFRNNYIDAEGVSRDDIYYSITIEEWKAIKTAKFTQL